MDNYKIGFSVKNEGFIPDTHSQCLKANSLQEAVDMAFAREVYIGKEPVSSEASDANRECIKVSDYAILNYDGTLRDYGVFNGQLKDPSRFSDSELRELLIKDKKNNNKRFSLSRIEEGLAHLVNLL